MNLQRDIEAIQAGGAGYVHVDVMDGHFVPNLTMGVPVVKQLKKITDMPLDVHLMISNPLEQLPWFLEAGADIVTVHAEAAAGYQLERAVEMIHAAGAKAAASVKPHTPVEVLAPVMAQLDMVLIMSVEPGFSGQSYIEGSERKVARTVELARAVGAAPLIEVDGGIGVKTAPLVAAAGADVLVCGSAVCGADDPAAAISQVTQAAEAARVGRAGIQGGVGVPWWRRSRKTTYTLITRQLPRFARKLLRLWRLTWRPAAQTSPSAATPTACTSPVVRRSPRSRTPVAPSRAL